MIADLRPVLDRIAGRQMLSEDEALAAFDTVMAGGATPAQIAGFAMGLRVRGETVSELVGAARAMRGRMRAVQGVAGAIDVCGTGGDGHATLNVSTAVAFVLAALGVPVAKHGNRAVSSRAGASDTLEALGILPEADPMVLAESLRMHGLAFLAAPLHHPAMRHAAVARAELGVRTIFNLLGPLCNPAGVRRQMVGVFDPAWQLPVARALDRLGCDRAWVVHGEDAGGGPGLDEFGLAGPTRVLALQAGRLARFKVEPGDVGLAVRPIAAISGGGPADNAAALLRLLDGETGAYRDTVLLNTAAALQVGAHGHISEIRGDDTPMVGVPGDEAVLDYGTVIELPPPRDGLRDGLARAARAIDDGSARAVLLAMRRRSGPGPSPMPPPQDAP